jgi:hypothetical protein
MVRTIRPNRHFWAAKTCSTRDLTRVRVASPRAMCAGILLPWASCVDRMDARRILKENWERHNREEIDDPCKDRLGHRKECVPTPWRAMPLPLSCGDSGSTRNCERCRTRFGDARSWPCSRKRAPVGSRGACGRSSPQSRTADAGRTALEFVIALRVGTVADNRGSGMISRAPMGRY